MPSKKPALGRGLNALLPPVPEPPAKVEAAVGNSLDQVAIDRIRPNPFQPRSSFNSERIRELADSIRAQGILQPILVRSSAIGYEIVAGERRWRAAQIAGLTEVPVIVKDLKDKAMLEAAVIENVQRDDLNPIEEASSYRRLTAEFDMTQEELAKTIGKSRVYITNAIRLLKLPRPVIDLIERGELSAGHGRALLGIESAAAQHAMAVEAATDGLSVREVERRVKQGDSPPAPPAKTPEPGARDAVRDDVVEIEEKLSEMMGLKIRLRPKTNTSGKIEIQYHSLDEFQQVCSQLGLDLSKAL